MKITIVGGHGSIAMLLHPILKAKGHEVRGIIRKEEQAEDLREVGAEPVICDIEETADISEAVGNVDAVLFAAGAGPGSGVARKWTVDRDGAIKLINAAKKNGINRYVMISAMGTDTPRGNEVFRTYLQAKEEADEALRNSGLDYTIIKPGRLTDQEGTGKVSLAQELERGEIPRADVAAVLAEVLETPETAGLQLDLVSGEQSIPEAVREVSVTKQ
ncbi:SDR family oxidoreductase [Aliifodinibius sp. S!AR15-10]|uniref:SDR family oxidoreductase n=1 Tax=Aliifodinibius sp. S!AR15-10 TaxID=2950437 RepID=UPI002865C99D|nr:SDR family oxidoreductase [Aliifodinibius sp. S!AR15-10]MDR8389633.1 SDR family oxidoreductase [Aliifodinibius sp. S!AR15-10]